MGYQEGKVFDSTDARENGGRSTLGVNEGKNSGRASGRFKCLAGHPAAEKREKIGTDIGGVSEGQGVTSVLGPVPCPCMIYNFGEGAVALEFPSYHCFVLLSASTDRQPAGRVLPWDRTSKGYLTVRTASAPPLAWLVDRG